VWRSVGEENIMDDFLGPFCQEIHLSIDNLNDPKPIKNGVLKTGVLFELYSHYKTVAKVIHIVHILEPSLATSSVDSLSTKFKRLLETKKKLENTILSFNKPGMWASLWRPR